MNNKFVWYPGDLNFVEPEEAQKMVDDFVRKLEEEEKKENKKESEDKELKSSESPLGD